MKKNIILLLRFIFVFVTILFIKTNHHIYAKSEIENSAYDRSISITSVDDFSTLDFSLTTNEYNDVIVSALDNDTHCSMNTTYFNTYPVEIKKHTVCYEVVDQVIYGIYYHNVESILYTYNIKTKEYNEISIEATIYDITYYDEKIVLVGQENNDACIYNFQKNLLLINKKYFGGNGYESFSKTFVIDEYLLILGVKDAYSKGSCFSHVGNLDEQKVFLIKVNEKLEVVNDFYINENTIAESIMDCYCNSEYISFLVKDDTNVYHQYVINHNFEVILKVDLNNFFPTSIYIIPHQTKEHLVMYLYTIDKKLYLGTLDNNTIHTTYLGDYFEIYSLDIKKGNLEIVIKDNNQIKMLTVKEYHMNKLEPFYYNQFVTDYKSTYHLDISSYFEELELVFDDNKNAYMNYQKSGTYQATYIANKLDGTNISIETDYIIPTFINIVHLGVYQTGYQLLFNDTVLVDDERVYNGDCLQKEGRHLVKHIIGDTTTEYVIYVFSKENTECFIDMSNHYQNTAYTIYPGTIFYYQLEITSPKGIKDVIINKKSHSFICRDNLILIPINGTIPGNIEIYHLSKIIYDDLTSVSLNETFSVRTLNNPFQIEARLQDEDIIYNFKNNKNCLIDLVSRTYQNEMLQEEVHYKIQSQKIVIPKSLSKTIVYARYTLGDQIIYEVELFSLMGIAKGKKDVCLDVVFTRNDDDLTMKVQGTHQSKIKINDITIQKQNLTKSFLVEENKTIIYIAIVLSAIIILLFITYFVVKLIQKQKRFKN